MIHEAFKLELHTEGSFAFPWQISTNHAIYRNISVFQK
jgi:hypothetical protein